MKARNKAAIRHFFAGPAVSQSCAGAFYYRCSRDGSNKYNMFVESVQAWR